MKRTKHFSDSLGSVVGNIRARAECFISSALENCEIGFGQRALQGCVQKLHHGSVQNIQWRAIERDPSSAVLEAKPNWIRMSCHARRAMNIGAICRETAGLVFQRKRESPRCSLRKDNSEPAPELRVRGLRQVFSAHCQTKLS